MFSVIVFCVAIATHSNSILPFILQPIYGRNANAFENLYGEPIEYRSMAQFSRTLLFKGGERGKVDK